MKVVIVGGGIIGLTSAYHLVKQGEEVVVVEANTLGSGASDRNAGWVVPAESAPVAAPGMVVQSLKWMLKQDSPLYIRPSLKPGFVGFMLAMAKRCNLKDYRDGVRLLARLAEGTMALYDSYASDGVQFEMHERGLMQAYLSRDKLDHAVELLDIQTEIGLDPEVLYGTELTNREPQLSRDLAGGIFYAHERYLRPESLVKGLVARCRELGVTFLEFNAVEDFHRSGSRVDSIILPSGPLEADQFLLASGAFTAELSSKLGVKLPIRPGKGYSVDYEPSPVGLKSAVNLCDAKVAVTPLDAGVRLSGTMEFAGLDSTVNPLRIAAIKEAPRRFFAEWPDPSPVPTRKAWVGIRPMTPDGLPIIGRLPGLDNAYVAAGHGMLGITLGPATGALVAEAISSKISPDTLAPFDPRRCARAVVSG